MSQPRIFLQLFLYCLQGSCQCVFRRLFGLKLFLDQDMQVVGKIAGGQVTSMSVKHCKVLVDLSPGLNYMHSDPIFIFDPGAFVGHVCVLAKIVKPPLCLQFKQRVEVFPVLCGLAVLPGLEHWLVRACFLGRAEGGLY